MREFVIINRREFMKSALYLLIVCALLSFGRSHAACLQRNHAQETCEKVKVECSKAFAHIDAQGIEQKQHKNDMAVVAVAAAQSVSGDAGILSRRPVVSVKQRAVEMDLWLSALPKVLQTLIKEYWFNPIEFLSAVYQEPSILKGHTGEVRRVAITPDGKIIATASEDGTARVWNKATGVCMTTLKGHHAGLRSIALRDNGKMIITSSWDNSIKTWDGVAGQCVGSFVLVGHRGFCEAVVSADGNTVVTASMDKTVRVWNRSTGQCDVILRHDDEVHAVALAPDGTIVTSSNKIRLWNKASGKCVTTLFDGCGYWGSIFIASKSDDIVTGDSGGNVKVFDKNTQQCRTQFKQKKCHGVDGYDAPEPFRCDSGDPIISIFMVSEDVIVVGSWKAIQIWHKGSNKCLAVAQSHKAPMRAVAVADDGTLVTGSTDKTAMVWTPHQELIKDALCLSLEKLLLLQQLLIFLSDDKQGAHDSQASIQRYPLLLQLFLQLSEGLQKNINRFFQCDVAQKLIHLLQVDQKPNCSIQ